MGNEQSELGKSDEIEGCIERIKAKLNKSLKVHTGTYKLIVDTITKLYALKTRQEDIKKFLDEIVRISNNKKQTFEIKQSDALS